ncbi:MAG TPA: PAS domain S-box protein, partial [Fimbriimonas sp.]|nr:PAS domain S-box protein [Fimbriimonas sp.]
MVFRTMADSAPVLMWMSDSQMRCTFFNEGWLRFTGRTTEQEMGSGWHEGIHADDRADCLNVFSSHFGLREPFEVEFRLRRLDGEYRWILNRGVPYNLLGTFAGYIGAGIDVTERREHQERLQEKDSELTRLNAELESKVQERTAALMAKNEDLEAFSYSVAHDLRGPIRGIVSNIRVAIEDSQGAIEPELVQNLEKAHAAALHLGAVVDDLLQFSRTGTQGMELSRFDLSEMFEDEFQRALQEAGNISAECKIQNNVVV